MQTDTLANHQTALLNLLARLSWRRGSVVLASGKKSDFYIDCKQTLLNSAGAWLTGQLVWAHIQKLRAQGLQIDAVGGLTLGADPIAVATAITSHGDAKPVAAFIIRKEPKQHGTAAWLEGSNNLPEQAQVLIVEDVVTTGQSTMKALERAKVCGLKPVAIVALVDRQEGGSATLAATGLPYFSLFCRADFADLN